MLRKLQEEDFAVLRGPLESGRQRPASLAMMLILSVFLQLLMFILTYVVAAYDTIFPYKNIIFVIHLFMTGVLIILSIVYAIPPVFLKGQKTQYLITILISQNLFGVFFYLSALFIIGEQRNITEKSLLTFTFITLLVGILIFIITSIRFYILLKGGQYRKGSKRDQVRSKLEFNIQSYLPMIIVTSVGLLFIIGYLVNVFGFAELETVMMMVLFILLFYTMLFVLPEQLVILYCKYNFESFNFNKNGELKPLERKGA